jgi:UDP-N-acetyl-D-galactosamine dehydrogenase
MMELSMKLPSDRRIAVIGLGYVGLPAALAFARVFPRTIGFDISAPRVRELLDGRDANREVDGTALLDSGIELTADAARLRDANFYIIAVPTPISASRHPDLDAVREASRIVGAALEPGDIVVYESTVYPGVTEDICGPILAAASQLRCGVDFTLGYSPERINPGDREHTFEKIVKVVSGQDQRTLDIVAEVYGAVIEVGVHRASSIRVAEASKVIENIQRDLNIALMNELAQIFDRLDIDTIEVLAAAGTKWNFLRFTPGLVGGHCIGVDPYYLAAKAVEVGINPQLILAGRRINDAMGEFVAQATIKQLCRSGHRVSQARVGVLGLAFKENVPDIRNSRVPDVVAELRSFGVEVLVHDPLVVPSVAMHEYGIEVVRREELHDLAAVILAVPHTELMPLAVELAAVTPVVIDVKAKLDRSKLAADTWYWRL